MPKIKVGILGATGMVGQRFVQLLKDHPQFEVIAVAASPRSAGKTYEEAVEGRWKMNSEIPERIKNLMVLDVNDIETIRNQVDFVFSALDMDKADIRALEDAYANAEVPVVSNNSAHRWTDDVPMIIPEVNANHLAAIDIQRKNHDRKKGFIAVKSNCSIQSYLPVLAAWNEFGIKEVNVTTMQAISGAGKTFETWPEMVDNVIPHIGGEDAKSEKEPLKVMGRVEEGVGIVPLKAEEMPIHARCHRVAALDGHLADVTVTFKNAPTREELIEKLKKFPALDLPSAPNPVFVYHEAEDRPQTRLDRDAGNGMAISVGKLEEISPTVWRFSALSHNTIRGAAGGAILLAELLKQKGYMD